MPSGVPRAPDGVPDAALGAPGAAESGEGWGLWALTAAAAIGALVLSVVGFAGSYQGLRDLAVAHHMGSFASAFPVGVDAGIVACLALDIHLIRRGTPWPLLRAVAHLLTLATIAFNASAAPGRIQDDWIGAAMHAVLPVLFVTAVEAGRRLILQATGLNKHARGAGVPLARWLLAPWSAWPMYRRMRLRGIPSYDRAVAMEQELIGYRTMLDRKYGGRGGWKSATPEERLPFTMQQYGYDVAQALALPAQYQAAEQARAEAARRAEAEARERAEQERADAEIRRLRTQGRVEQARHQVAAETGTAAAEAAAAEAAAKLAAEARQARARRVVEAEDRAAEVEAEAEESAAVAEARARALEAERRAAEADRAAAEARQAAAEADRAAAETRARAAEADRRETEEKRHKAAVEAEAERARQAAAEARQAAAEAELRALEAEDLAGLKPSERAARRVARMILATGSTDPESVELSAVAGALGVSLSTASERRREAGELIAAGYRPGR